MDYWQMLREIVESSGKSLSQVSREIGKSRSFLSVALHDRKMLRVDLFCRVLEVCGHHMTIEGPGVAYNVLADREEWPGNESGFWDAVNHDPGDSLWSGASATIEPVFLSDDSA